MDIADIQRRANDLCQKYGVKTLYVFGSVVRGDDHENSDIDCLVEFQDQTGLFDKYMDLKTELSHRLGRSIDLVTTNSIRNPIFRKVVERERILVYG
jgi:predicted nucleotidyltransferase